MFKSIHKPFAGVKILFGEEASLIPSIGTIVTESKKSPAKVEYVNFSFTTWNTEKVPPLTPELLKEIFYQAKLVKLKPVGIISYNLCEYKTFTSVDSELALKNKFKFKPKQLTMQRVQQTPTFSTVFNLVMTVNEIDLNTNRIKNVRANYFIEGIEEQVFFLDVERLTNIFNRVKEDNLIPTGLAKIANVNLNSITQAPALPITAVREEDLLKNITNLIRNPREVKNA